MSTASRATPEADGFVWRLVFPNVRRRERERFRFLAILAGVIMLAQTVGLAGADALFLATYGAKALPVAFILASAVAVTGSLAYSFAVGRARNDMLFVWLLLGTSSAILVFAGLLFGGQRWTLYAFFAGVYLTQAVIISLHYLTLAGDYFDTVSSKRIFPYLIACSSFGGILGGLLALGLARVVRTEWLLVAWALFLLLSAFLLLRARRDLKRWMPVGSDVDESSAEGMLAALRFIRRSALSRWLTISVVGLVFALFLMQYLEMEIFAASFDTPEALASFIAIYLAVTNGIEILVASIVAPFLIRRLGVAQANLVHPVLSLAAFGVLAFWPSLWVAVMARANRELLDNALAAPIRALVYNALAFRFRGRMRAFLGGIVFYAAMSTAGLALLLMRDSLDATMICIVGACAAIVYFGASWMVRREYLASILDELRSGRLDLAVVGSALGEVELEKLAEHWEASLSESAQSSRGWRELPAVLVRHGIREPLERNARHPQPAVRVACIEALATEPDAALAPILVAALGDADPSVRLAAAIAVDAISEHTAALEGRLEQCLGDDDLQVRARAASHLGARGVGTLRAMVTQQESEAVVEALRFVPVDLLPEARARLGDSVPAVRAGALACATRLGDGPSLTLERLEQDASHEDAVVRLAAVRAVASLGDGRAAPVLARGLDDRNRDVRAASSRALGNLGDVGVLAARPVAGSIRRWTADAALQAIARAGGNAADEALHDVFRQCVADAWETRVAHELVPRDDGIATRFLETALRDGHARSCWLALRVLEFLEDPVVVRSVRKALDYTNPRDRADALEVLSNLGDREVAREFSLLLEEGPLEDKLSSLPTTRGLPTTYPEVLERAEESEDRWLQLAVAASRETDDASVTPEVRIMENLLALRRVPLFEHLSLEQLEAIGRFMQEERYLQGEVVVREGDLGEDLFVIVEGEVVAMKNYGTPEQIELTTMNPEGLCYFGEIAIFDRAARSATVVVTQDARMLRLEGDRFTELILQSPEISFEIFKVFSGRLRVAEERIRAQEDQERAPESSRGAS